MEDNQFELSPELTEQIIFAMENQKEIFYLNPDVPSIVPEEQKGANGYELPLWEPSDGYRLMEQFVLSLRNPVYKEHLHSILHSGSGVFRKYKDALNQRPDIERMWFSFKDREMKSRVAEWYNALRLEWGLETFEIEFNGEYSPVMTDFSIVPCSDENLDKIIKFEKDAYTELFPNFPADYLEDRLRRQRDGFELEISHDSSVLCAESPDGDVVGFIWFTSEELEGGTVVGRLRQVYILPEFRGLGLSIKLKDQALNDPLIKNCSVVEVEIPEKASFLSRMLQLDNFSESAIFLTRYKKGESF